MARLIIPLDGVGRKGEVEQGDARVICPRVNPMAQGVTKPSVRHQDWHPRNVRSTSPRRFSRSGVPGVKR